MPDDPGPITTGERIARKIEARAAEVDAEIRGKEWLRSYGAADRRNLERRAFGLREAARIARETPEEKTMPEKPMNRRHLIAAISLGLAGAAAPARAGETGPAKPWYLQDYVDGIWHLAVANADGPFVDTIYVVGPRRPRRVSTYTIFLGFAGELVSTVGTYGGVDADAIAAELSRRHAYPVVHLPIAN